eukprot:468610_1
MVKSRIMFALVFTWLITQNNASPNILFILVDDLGWNDLSYHKGCDYSSPNIDKLASNALELNNYYIQHICSPTRSALLSGTYPIHTGLQHGVIGCAAPYGLPLHYTIIPQDLKSVNYGTHIIGKWHIGFFAPSYTPIYRGFDTHFGYYCGMEDYYYHNNSANGDKGYDFRNQTEPIFIPNSYSTYLYGNETIRILKKYDNDQENKNWFIYLPFQGVHSPLQAPQYIIDSFNKTITDTNRRKKAAMVTVLDDVIGQIINFLQHESKKQLWDNLVLIFSTDNGGPVQQAASNFPLRGNKATLWEGGVKGAGFISGGWLNKTRRGKTMNGLFHITDWYPTLMDIVGIKASNSSILDGYSQLNNIQIGESDIYSPRSQIVHNIDPVGCTNNMTICGGIRMKDYKLVIGREVDKKSTDGNGCMNDCGWCPLSDVNQNYTSIQCSVNGGNYGFPNLTQNYIKNNCPFNQKPCLYNIVSDPCEYYDLSQNDTQMFEKIYNRLLYYNSTMVTPLSLLYPVNSTAANPANLGGFWGPWINNTNFTNKIEL